MNKDFFPGFKKISIKTSECTINGVMGGAGPPLLLLHGYPQSHIEWHRLAPMLAKDYTLVITDLRGYGDSSKPADGENHIGYSKRSMARDQVEVMQQLGFNSFSVVAHDRGARVAHRLALDYPGKVIKLALLDIVPTHKLYATTNRMFATYYWHWFFLIQPAPLPETLLREKGEFILKEWAFSGLSEEVIPKDVLNEYIRHFNEPATLHAMCEDYRAGASIDLLHDEADMDKKVKCPVLVLWGGKGAMEPLYKVLDTWKERADIVTGKSLPCGHWIPEQLPNELYAELRDFLI
ncbi:MAG: alpha/beta hydrolase [Bacteroidetes bacterium]|nr:alpha/beta hydrolase [Bacteroidota bacterium]